MPVYETNIVRSLTEPEIQILSDEISNLPMKFWVKHYPIPNLLLRLRDGESVHLNWPSEKTNVLITERRNELPNVWNFILECLGDDAVGRAYIHRLKPNDSINKHHDDIHVKSMNILNRYHIYLDIPDNVELFFDDENVENPLQFKNTLVDFALSRLHYYKNWSNQNWYFIVFDKIEKNHNE